MLRGTLKTLEAQRHTVKLKQNWQAPDFLTQKRARLEAFVTRDARTLRLSWEAICLEPGYAYDSLTVEKAMHDMEYHKRLPRKKLSVSPGDKKRVAWCQVRLHWTREEWERVIWADESSFPTAGFGHRSWVIRKTDEEYHPDCTDRNLHFDRKSKTIWGAFCGTTKDQIVYVPGRAKIDAATYVRTVLKPALAPIWHQCCEEYLVWMGDCWSRVRTALRGAEGIQVATGH